MQDTTSAEPTQRATRREWLGLAVLGLPTMLIALDIGVLFLALPSLTADLRITSTEQLWITDAYGFMMAGLLITMGTLGDRIGRRKLLLIGAACFGVISVVAAYSTSGPMLIISRAALGIAGATLMPSTLALITNMFRDERQRRTAIAAWVSCLMTGSAIGPVVGGLLLNQFWWGSVFLLGVPVMILLLVFGRVLLPEFKNPNAGRLDIVSVLLSLAAILPIIYALKELAVHGLGNPTVPIVAAVAGVILGVLFVRRQLHLSSPLLDLRLFENRSFSATLTSMTLAAAALAGVFLLVSQYVQTGLEYSPAKAGLWLAPAGIAIAIGSQLAPVLSRRLAPPTVIASGLVFGATGFLMLAMAHSVGGIIMVVVGLAVVHVGAGPLFALGAHLVVGSVPPERAGSAASMSETANAFGSTLGLAVMGTIGAAIYRHQMNDVDLSGLPAEPAQAARETLAGATSAAAEAPPGTAPNLLDAARNAFTDGMNAVAVVALVVFIGLAVLIIVGARASKAAAAAAEGESESAKQSALSG